MVPYVASLAGIRGRISVKSVSSAEDGEKLQNAVVGQEWKPLPYLLSITNLLLHDIEAPNIANCDSLGTNITDFKESDKVDVIGMNPPYGGSTEDSVKSNFPVQQTTGISN